MPNSRFEVKPFDPKYFGDPFKEGVRGIPGWTMFNDAAGFARYLAGLAAHPAYCAFYEGELIGAAGVIITYRGVGEAWAMVLPGARQCARSFHKAVKLGLREIALEHDLHRIEAGVHASFLAGKRWAVGLGFKPESVRRMAGTNKEDIITFAMFPGDVWHKAR